jgi:hypothetical protein
MYEGSGFLEKKLVVLAYIAAEHHAALPQTS